jgi:hypothetical protein
MPLVGPSKGRLLIPLLATPDRIRMLFISLIVVMVVLVAFVSSLHIQPNFIRIGFWMTKLAKILYGLDDIDI